MTADSAEKVYDGKTLTATGFSGSGMADGDHVESAKVEGTRTDAGSSANVVSNATVVNADGADVTSCYEITYETGTLTVTKRPITFTGMSETKDYSGSEIEISTVEEDGLVKGHIHNVTFSAKGIETGEYEGNITQVDDVVIKSGESDVTTNYDITTKNGALTIQQNPEKKLEVSLKEGTFVYDGEAHALPAGATTNASTGDTKIEYSKDGEVWITDLASITATSVTDSCNIRVRATNPNYANIAEGSAPLTIEPAKATITIDDATKIEGEADPAFTGKVNGLVAEGDLGEITYRRTNTDEVPGSYEGVITAGYTANGNYDVTVNNGHFTITAKDTKNEYQAVSGTGGTWTKESTETLTFTFKRIQDDSETFEHFTGVLVDGKAVSAKDAVGNANWTAAKGSVIIDLQAAYLDTLDLGKHILTAVFDDGSATADFTILAKEEEKPTEEEPTQKDQPTEEEPTQKDQPTEKKETTPETKPETKPEEKQPAAAKKSADTGDTGPLLIWSIIIPAAVAGITVTVIFSKKRRNM